MEQQTGQTGQSGQAVQTLDRDAELAEELGAVLRRLHSFIRRTVLPREMSLSQAVALGTLRELGPQRVTDLAEYAGVRQPTATALVNAMEEKGWVVRRISDADRRAVRVELTGEGREVLESITAARTGLFRGYLSALTASEKDALAAALPVLERVAEISAGAVSVPG